jgi:subtilisin family serine protease
MDPLDLTNLRFLMDRTAGSPGICIAIIDGPVSLDHPDLNLQDIIEVTGKKPASCAVRGSISCSHGTFIVGMLKARRSSRAPAICPGCKVMIRQIFSEGPAERHPEAAPAATLEDLATAVIDCVMAGAKIINLSLALPVSISGRKCQLDQALDYAANKEVIVVAAAGNQGQFKSNTITRHPWTIPVIACNGQGYPLGLSNLSKIIGRQGFSAPGENIISLDPQGGITLSSGTSFAAPFVTGAIALLWSEFPHLSATDIKSAVNSLNNKRSIVPPLMNAKTAYDYLYSVYDQRYHVA